MRARHFPTLATLSGALLFAAAACENGGGGAAVDESSPWLTVLADVVLDARQRLDDVPERPIVNVATATGLEHHMGALSLLPGVIDRDTRPRYVARVRDGVPLLSEVPVEEPPPIPLDGGWLPPPGAMGLIGPYTIALDGVEVDTETRKVAVLTVFSSTVPYVGYKGKIRRIVDTPRPAVQYRVEGHWDGRRWVAEIKRSYAILKGYYNPATLERLPGLHTPGFVYPREPVQ